MEPLTPPRSAAKACAAFAAAVAAYDLWALRTGRETITDTVRRFGGGPGMSLEVGAVSVIVHHLLSRSAWWRSLVIGGLTVAAHRVGYPATQEGRS